MAFDFYKAAVDDAVEAAEARSAGEIARLRAALQRLHDECCTYSDHGRIVRLNLGPMLEPSEAAVLEARKVLEGGEQNGDR